MPMWRYEIISLFREAYNRGELKLPKDLQATCPNKAAFNRWLNIHYQKSWIIHFAKPSKNHHRNIKYLGRYLKRPPLSMSRLRHYDGKEVIFSYLNHATKEYLRFSSKVEDFIKRLVQHIPDKVGRFAATFCPVQPSNLWEIPVIFFCLSLLTLIPRTAKDRAIKSLIFHVLLFASFVCLAESQTHSYIVELEQNADLPSQNFSIKPEPDTLPAMQMIDMGSLQGKPTEMTNISGYSGSDTPPDDKPYWPRSFWESLTTVVESVTWQLLYASNEVIGYKLLLAFQKDSYQPQPFSWMPVVATVVVGWLTRSNWNPEAPLFNQLDEQESNKQHELQIITLMNNPSGGHTWSTGTWGQGQSFTTHSFTSSSHYSFVNHQNGYNEDDPGRPNSPRHSYGENCHEHPCYTRRGHCIYAPPIQHLAEYWYEDCLAVSYIPELATHQAQTPPPVITRCHLNPDASTTCSASVHPYTSYPESSVAEADSASSQSLAESGATAHAAAVGADTTAPLASGQAGHLRRHTATVHEKKKDHICQHQGDDGQPCGRAFGQAGHLRTHIATVHEKKKDHICQHQGDDGQPCGRAFGRAGNLRTHIATVHEKKKDHICQHQGDDGQPCGRAFGLAGNLRRHIATVHEKKKDHICQHQGDDGQPCGRAFGLAGDLRTHIATVHEKKKDHICQHQGDDGQPCGRAFGRAGHLRTHIATVHEKKKDHICQHQGDDGQPCGRAFGLAGDLRRHIATVHEKKKDHICQHQGDDGQPCGRAFGRAGHLRTHIATVHEKGREGAPAPKRQRMDDEQPEDQP